MDPLRLAPFYLRGRGSRVEAFASESGQMWLKEHEFLRRQGKQPHKSHPKLVAWINGPLGDATQKDIGVRILATVDVCGRGVRGEVAGPPRSLVSLSGSIAKRAELAIYVGLAF